MKGVRFHDSKLKLIKALLFRSFHETEAPTAGFCSAFICGRVYCLFNFYGYVMGLVGVGLFYQP